ncbi:MAG: hypothetical protein Q3979_09495 [Actinomycetaceae bacterium]|nr:hypothetical protein [Actinomycetaceae bacterium]
MNRWSTIVYRMQPIMIVGIPVMFFVLPRGFTATLIVAAMYFGLLLPTVVSLGIIMWTSAVRALKLGVSQTGPLTTWALTAFYFFAIGFGCSLGDPDGGRSALSRIGIASSVSSTIALTCIVLAGVCLAFSFVAATVELIRVDDVAQTRQEEAITLLGYTRTVGAGQGSDTAGGGAPARVAAGTSSSPRKAGAWSRFLYRRGLGVIFLPVLFLVLPVVAGNRELESLSLGVLGVATPMSAALFLAIVPVDLRARRTGVEALGPITTWLSTLYCALVIVAACTADGGSLGRTPSVAGRLGLSEGASSAVHAASSWLAIGLAVASIAAAWWEYYVVRGPKLPMISLWEQSDVWDRSDAGAARAAAT